MMNTALTYRVYHYHFTLFSTGNYKNFGEPEAEAVPRFNEINLFF
jgi:hypothetical protein